MKGKKDIENIVGKKFGRLTILEYLGSDKMYRTMVKAKCECGNERIVRLSQLTFGQTTSCGCYNRERVLAAAKTHGLSKTPLYKVWTGLKGRCLNPNSESYKYYGGRGITLYKYWQDDFTHFAYWCVKHGWKKGLEIDRIDNDKGYYPDNCRVTTEVINSRNRRNNRNITINGVTKVLMDWCNEFGIKHNTVLGRIKRGWDEKDLFINPKHKNIQINNL